MVGNVIGRGPHFIVEADRHHGNLFCTKAQLEAVDPTWQRDRIAGGLSSGEGLIWQVRDPIDKREPIRERGRVVGYQDVCVDPGVADERLLVVETELASTLRVLGREGNTLSAIVRQAWDTGALRTLTKNSPAVATNAHVSIIGHITRTELRRYLDRTEAGNGFANRFLWVCARRSKVLPEGGALHHVDFGPLQRALAQAVEFARAERELRRDGDARSRWAEVYGPLSTPRPGLLGAVTSRAEPQVMRLAMLYALLDRSAEIRLAHLEAALEVWRYCADSARFIFGDDLGDPVADEILRELRATSSGLTRTEIRDHFGRHQGDRPGTFFAGEPRTRTHGAGGHRRQTRRAIVRERTKLRPKRQKRPKGRN